MKHFYLSEIYTILCICFIFGIYLCIGLSISDIDILIHGLQFLGSLFPNNFCWLLLFPNNTTREDIDVNALKCYDAINAFGIINKRMCWH